MILVENNFFLTIFRIYKCLSKCDKVIHSDDENVDRFWMIKEYDGIHYWTCGRVSVKYGDDQNLLQSTHKTFQIPFSRNSHKCCDFLTATKFQLMQIAHYNCLYDFDWFVTHLRFDQLNSVKRVNAEVDEYLVKKMLYLWIYSCYQFHNTMIDWFQICIFFLFIFIKMLHFFKYDIWVTIL